MIICKTQSGTFRAYNNIVHPVSTEGAFDTKYVKINLDLLFTVEILTIFADPRSSFFSHTFKDLFFA